MVESQSFGEDLSQRPRCQKWAHNTAEVEGWALLPAMYATSVNVLWELVRTLSD